MKGLAQRLFIERFQKKPWTDDIEEAASKWLFLDRMAEEGRLSYIDLAVAQRILNGLEADNEAAATLICHLSRAIRQGHLCIKIEEESVSPSPDELWMSSEKEIFEETSCIIEEIRRRIVAGARVFPTHVLYEVSDGSEEVLHPVYRRGNSFYFQRCWQLETLFVNAAKSFIFSRLPSVCINTEIVRDKIFKLVEENKLLSEQAEAVLQGCSSSFTVITGGPGTGKTHTAGMLLRILWECLSKEQRSEIRIELAAPTGKAAANLEASIQRAMKDVEHFPCVRAKTLHGLLGIKGSGRRRKGVKTLQADVLIVDESSMIDVEMMGILMSSIKSGSRLILLGDRHQLPPVESGSLFADLVAVLEKSIGPARVIELKKCLRSELQGILTLAEEIKRGHAREAIEILEGNHSELEGISYVSFDEKGNVKELQRRLLHQFVNDFPFIDSIPDNLQAILEGFSRFRILTPLRKGPFGVEALNLLFFNEFFNRARKAECFVVPIMIAQNSVRTNLVNGEVGLLLMHQYGNKSNDFAFFPERGSSQAFRKIPFLLLPKFEYAYCISVHKSQGSEFDRVVMLLPEGAEFFGREALYTGVTRARRSLELWASPAIVSNVIGRASKRHSNVVERMVSVKNEGFCITEF